MKRTLAFLPLFLLALAAFAASAERFTPAKGSLVRIEGTSTLHDWSMEGTTISGQIENTNGEANVVVAIPVESIKSEHAKMDRLMADALKAKSFPQIKYELTQPIAQPAGTTFNVKTTGKLTIAGVTREVTLDVQGTRGADGRYTLTGTAPIKMSAFGIKPPTAMLNTIKTGDDVKVTFRWVVEKSN